LDIYQASDIEIHAREAIALKRRMEEIAAQHSGQQLEKVSNDIERDYFMTAEERRLHEVSVSNRRSTREILYVWSFTVSHSPGPSTGRVDARRATARRPGWTSKGNL
jgi:Clp protease